jgi:hypothetical protein
MYIHTARIHAKRTVFILWRPCVFRSESTPSPGSIQGTRPKNRFDSEGMDTMGTCHLMRRLSDVSAGRRSCLDQREGRRVCSPDTHRQTSSGIVAVRSTAAQEQQCSEIVYTAKITEYVTESQNSLQYTDGIRS